jgi:ribosomal protein S21
MATVNNRGDKDVEFLLKIFRKEVDKENLMSELKKRRYFTKPSRERHLNAKRIEHKIKLEKKYPNLNAERKNQFKN